MPRLNMAVLRMRVLQAVLLAYFVSLTRGLQMAYCSPDNTGADTGYEAGTEH